MVRTERMVMACESGREGLLRLPALPDVGPHSDPEKVYFQA